MPSNDLNVTWTWMSLQRLSDLNGSCSGLYQSIPACKCRLPSTRKFGEKRFSHIISFVGLSVLPTYLCLMAPGSRLWSYERTLEPETSKVLSGFPSVLSRSFCLFSSMCAWQGRTEHTTESWRLTELTSHHRQFFCLDPHVLVTLLALICFRVE